MEYITRHCPSCHGELQVPSDLKSCICMYCGVNFNIEDEIKEEISAEAGEALAADYRKMLNDLPLLINDYEKMLPLFTWDKYAHCFTEYEELGRKVLEPAELYAGISEENTCSVPAEVAISIYSIIEKVIDAKSAKRKVPKGTIIDQFRFFQTVYLIPMIRHLNFSISEPIVDGILEAWIKNYSKYPFKKSDYNQILAGFKRKGLCFITSAVCETMKKEDDCYELTAFRRFRDNYMLQTEDRRAKVEEYYRIAPAIVTSIDMEPDADKKYEKLWLEYLQPCLKAIEENHLEVCEKLYSNMVYEMKNQYLIMNN